MISAGMEAARKLTSYVSTEDEGGPKNFGDASLHPRAFQTELEEAYLFFFLAFFFAAINLFTSIGKPKRASNGQNIGPCRICGTICSSFKSFCQEKSVEKIENGILEGLRGVEKFPSGSRASIILTGPDPGK